MHRLAAMHSITDRQTDDSIMPKNSGHSNRVG